MTDHEHDHAHPHEPIGHDGEPPAAARARALEELLVEKGVLTREAVRQGIDWLVSRSPADGARLPCMHDFGERRHRVIDRHFFEIRPMQPIEIDALQPETLQAACESLVNCARSTTTAQSL